MGAWMLDRVRASTSGLGSRFLLDRDSVAEVYCVDGACTADGLGIFVMASGHRWHARWR